MAEFTEDLNLEMIPEDILAIVLSSMDIETILHKRQIPLFRKITESDLILNMLSKMYDVPYKTTFIEFLEQYDKTRLTPRCLKYNKPYICGPYFEYEGNLDGMKRAKDLGWKKQKYYDGALSSAVKNGKLFAVKFFINQYVDKIWDKDFNYFMKVAVERGYLDIVKFLVENGANDFNGVLPLAIDYNQGGYYLDIIDYLIERGADNLEYALTKAAHEGYKELVEYFVDKGANNIEEGLISSIRYGNGGIELVDYFVGKGAANIKDGLEIATRKNNIELVDYFISKGATNLNKSLLEAIYSKNDELVDYLVRNGANNFNEGLAASAKKCNIKLIDYFISKGATNIQEVIQQTHYKKTLEHLKKYV